MHIGPIKNQHYKLDGRNHLEQDLLLRACERLNADYLLETVRLLLLVGADPTPFDNDWNSPLHILAAREEGEIYSPTAKLLLESGTHFDHVNMDEETPLEVWKRINVESPPPSWMTGTVPKLACLSARVIFRIKGITLNDQNIPKTLHSFVSLH